AVPFVPRHVYEARLDQLFSGNWSILSPSVVVSSNRIVVLAELHLGPVTRSDYGELLLPPPTEPHDPLAWVSSTPEAFDQAFVAACMRFGLGRTLGELAREWLPYDPKRGQIALSSEEQATHILKLYQQAGLLEPFAPPALAFSSPKRLEKEPERPPI